MGLSASGSGNLPVQLARFFGQEAETAELDRLLAPTRLVTLTVCRVAARAGSGSSWVGG
jgi:hypothetical protein